MPPDSLAGFSAMLKRALSPLLDPEANDFAAMMAEDGVMEFPFAPPDSVQRLVGRAAVATHVARLSEVLALDRVGEPVIHRTQDAGLVILEFEASGRVLGSGRPYQQRYISVITLRDGRIQRYLDYWNPLIVLDALGGSAIRTISQGAA